MIEISRDKVNGITLTRKIKADFGIDVQIFYSNADGALSFSPELTSHQESLIKQYLNELPQALDLNFVSKSEAPLLRIDPDLIKDENTYNLVRERYQVRRIVSRGRNL